MQRCEDAFKYVWQARNIGFIKSIRISSRITASISKILDSTVAHGQTNNIRLGKWIYFLILRASTSHRKRTQMYFLSFSISYKSEPDEKVTDEGGNQKHSQKLSFTAESKTIGPMLWIAVLNKFEFLLWGRVQEALLFSPTAAFFINYSMLM